MIVLIFLLLAVGAVTASLLIDRAAVQPVNDSPGAVLVDVRDHARFD